MDLTDHSVLFTRINASAVEVQCSSITEQPEGYFIRIESGIPTLSRPVWKSQLSKDKGIY